MSDLDLNVPEPTIEQPSMRRWPSPVWLVPLIAILVAFGLLFQNLATRGPMITIEFSTASGLSAGETSVKYRDVVVGRVEDVRFSDDLNTVLADVRMEATVAPFLDASAKFWVVRPQVTAQGITGLDTVISGSYIEGSWDTVPDAPVRVFVAEAEAPQTPEGTPGLRVRLRAEDGGSLEVGSPIFFKRVEVGRVESKQLTADGSAVEFSAFINAPNHLRINDATRFWNASGVDLQLGADGARLRIASLASLVRGGASFDTSPQGNPIQAGHVFALFGSESDARDLVDSGDLSDQVQFQVFFSGSVRGLRPGASVESHGIRVGRVNAVSAAVDPQTNRFRTRTTISLSPVLLGLPGGDHDAVMTYMRAAVQSDGLRAKLAMGNLLTGALYVNLEEVGDASPARIDESGDVPVLPSIASDLDELTGSVEGVLDRVNGLPIEALMGNAVALLDSLNRLAGSADTQAMPEKIAAILSAAEALVNAPELHQTTVEAQAFMAALRQLAEDPALTTAPQSLASALTRIDHLMGDLERSRAADNVGASLAALRTMTETPEFVQLPASVVQTLAAIQTFVGDPALAEMPAQINATLADIRKTLDLPGLATLPREATAAIASLRARLDDPGLTTAMAELGPLIARARNAVDQISLQATPAIASLSAILDDPGTRAAPEELRRTLQAARTLLEEEGLRTATKEAAATLASLRALLEAPATTAAPAELTATLQAARKMLTSLVDADAAENLSQALLATRRLVDDPALGRAANELAETLGALRVVLNAPGMDTLPAATSEALAAAADMIEQFQRENLGGAAVGALAGIEGAGRAVEKSVAGLPALLRRLNALSKRADTLLASVSVGSELNYEAVAAIREIRDAARAVTDLADLVQQKPNSIILGK